MNASNLSEPGTRRLGAPSSKQDAAGEVPNADGRSFSHEAVVTVREYHLQLLRQMSKAFDLVFTHLQQRWAMSKSRHDDAITEEIWHEGDMVYLHSTAEFVRSHMRKLTNPWIGPYVITVVHSSHRVELLIPTPKNPVATQIVTTARIRRYVAPFVQAWDVKHQGYKFPETLLSTRVHKGQREFLVQWLMPHSTACTKSWVNADHLPATLVESFQQRAALPIVWEAAESS